MVNSEKQLKRVIELGRHGELQHCPRLRKRFVCKARGEVLVQFSGQCGSFRELSPIWIRLHFAEARSQVKRYIAHPDGMLQRVG